MHVSEIGTSVIEAKPYGEAARPAMIHRVRANLAYLWRHGRTVTQRRGIGRTRGGPSMIMIHFLRIADSLFQGAHFASRAAF
jgi:hypothetical protein